MTSLARDPGSRVPWGMPIVPATLLIMILLRSLPAWAEGGAAPSGSIGVQAPPVSVAVRKSVLLLFPYQFDLPVSTLALQGIREELGAVNDLSVDLYCEYLDINRFSDSSYRQQVLNLLAAKYRNKRIDVVILASEVMLNIWMENRGKIAPDSPVVFYDITPERLSALTDLYGGQFPSNIIGVTGIVDYAPSVKWVLRALPWVKEIVIVHGIGKADEDFSQPIEFLLEEMGGLVRFTELSNLPMPAIKGRLAALRRNSVVLYNLMFEDASGAKYRPIDALRELAAASAVPVISLYDQFIGTGTVGGYMYGIEQQAREAAGIGLRILRGEAPGSIPIIKDENNRFIFDHQALRRFGIPLSSLPPGSLVKNRQYSVWELYRSQISIIAVAFAVMLFLLVFLIAMTQRLRSARIALSSEKANLESQVRERTSTLTRVNTDLESEVTEHKRAEAALERSSRENKALLCELQHRAKNSFNMISCMIGMASGDDVSLETGKALDYLGARVRSVSELYDLLYSKGSFTEVRLDDYCARVAGPLIALAGNVVLETDLEGVSMSVKAAAPIGLILTELVTNAVKYAFPGGGRGTVTVGLRKTVDGKAILEVMDDGIGLPAGFDLSSDAGMGLNLVKGLAGQIDGIFRMSTGVVGTRCTLEFSIASK